MPEIKLESVEFESFLNRKGLSEETKKLYNLFYEKLFMIMRSTEREIDQEIANAFLDLYPHAISRAFLKNYAEYKDINLKIPKKTGTVAKKEVETIPDDDLEKIRRKLYEYDLKFGLMFDLSENCALRRQEVINIKCSDITLKNIDGVDCVFINLKKTKGNKQRSVFVLEKTAVTLIEYIANQNLLADDYLFKSPVNEGSPINKTVWNKAFTRASLDATGKKYHPHQLRHKRSLKWYEKGMDIVRIQQRLGHSNISTTRLYINPDKIKEMEKWSKEYD